MNPAATIRAYYESLRRGEPVSTYFVADPNAVKFGITERLAGSGDIAEGLQSRTETTTDWHVESHELTVGERAAHAWFADEVSMAWTDATDERHAHGTRWSGMLERRDEHDVGTRFDEDDENRDCEPEDGDARRRTNGTEWAFASMHVSRSGSLDRSGSC